MTGAPASAGERPYVLPFTLVRRAFCLDGAVGTVPFELPLGGVLDVIQHLLLAVPVDEAWYLDEYPDVHVSIDTHRAFSSASHHFATVGYFEGRQPSPEHASAIRLPLFADVAARLDVRRARDGLRVTVTPDELRTALGGLIAAVTFDPDFYARSYRPVVEAVEQGGFKGVHDHYVQVGYFEGRLAHDMALDVEWYLQTNADLRAAAERDSAFSARDHFNNIGYREGRLPRPNALQWLE